MKRSADDAFGGATGTFQWKPQGAALLDPKAYFAQFQQAQAHAVITQTMMPEKVEQPEAAKGKSKGAKGERKEMNIDKSTIQDLVRDRGRKLQDLSYEDLTQLLRTVARARLDKRDTDMQTVRTEDNDRYLFQLADRRICDEVDQIPVWLLAEVIYTHHQIGIKNDRLFKVLCPKIVTKQKDLREDQMARCIKAYRRFSVPLKEEAQGFRTMAIVQKGDFLRPSDKPKNMGKKVFEKPQALYPEPMLHAKN
ncbi:unnamed protein product [Effrenium voratum]|uniref:Uncharacterized protein n=1 Tax=Effrenium voratum TaxID=2562239 RepID=A0AA36HT77_9DINO|nr:unnamed protein product [Effrenium voratum]CAJ1374365.1 unnamed protein product [Effrenium voratum]CAJ1419609.1 unnamed protein product [Effrenium voratum]|mmetsp:Transcript_72842/g.173813  ORF Transcript_72842/g.173813 Transcript_72842/m.173813 type:complete len:251 (+) Transcript_72842:24-776(+)|eukprot:CAMPEP_0181446356 /NCGR_PEP_ID=MMETSP1110-20121109/26061_1 /TAXON_ID=174948 /ORGANISM="Symbiodinium sp., Strain CCMP421" /LENGTH=250 /DNA_ID=CAMNT_0023570429 /DNA_START=24 /DNA_END=776 /DNA_ORIENTATION=+